MQLFEKCNCLNKCNCLQCFTSVCSAGGRTGGRAVPGGPWRRSFIGGHLYLLVWVLEKAKRSASHPDPGGRTCTDNSYTSTARGPRGGEQRRARQACPEVVSTAGQCAQGPTDPRLEGLLQLRSARLPLRVLSVPNCHQNTLVGWLCR